MDVLKAQLIEAGVEYSEKLFKTEDGLGGLSGQIFVSFILQSFSFRQYNAAPFTESRCQDICCGNVFKSCSRPSLQGECLVLQLPKWFSSYNCNIRL